MSAGSDAAHSLMEILSFSEKIDQFQKRLNKDSRLFTPAGTPSGKHSSVEHLSSYLNWLKEKKAKWLPKSFITPNESKSVAAEGWLEWQDQKIPSAFVLQFSKNHLIESVRIYHTLYPFHQKHTIRNAIFPDTLVGKLPPDVQAYRSALAHGDAEAAIALYSPKGRVREPSGGFSGEGEKQSLEDFYRFAFKIGGVGILYHTVIDNGLHCAAEYTCHRWANIDLTPQAGIEFFDRDQYGKFQEVRIYDDVQQPRK